MKILIRKKSAQTLMACYERTNRILETKCNEIVMKKQHKMLD